MLEEPALVRGQEFTFDAGRENALRRVVAVPEDVAGDVGQILAAQGSEQAERPFLVGSLAEEGHDGGAIACGRLHEARGRSGKALFGNEGLGGHPVRETGHIGLPDAVLISHPAVVFSPLRRGHFRQRHILHGRDDGEQFGNAGRRIQRNGRLGVFAEMDLHIPVGTVLGGPDKHVAETGGQGRAAVGIRIFGHGRIELRGVVDAEVHPGTLHRSTALRKHPEADFRGLGIIADEVDLRIARGAEDYFLGAVIVAEHLGMGKHRPGRGGVEPAEVQHRFGFAGADEHPLPVGPGLHPGVVAFRVGPARRIDLAGRNAHGTERGDAEGRFFPASAQAVLYRDQRGVGTAVGGLVGHLLMAPVVHFQDGLLHGQALHPRFQFVIKDQPGGIQVLVVGPEGQHEMAELAFGDLPAHFLPRLEGLPHVREIESGRIVRHIRERHVRIQEFKGFPFFGRQRLSGTAAVPVHGRERRRQRRHPRLIVFPYLVPVRFFLQEMGGSAGGRKQHDREGEDCQSFHIFLIGPQIYKKSQALETRPG